MALVKTELHASNSFKYQDQYAQANIYFALCEFPHFFGEHYLEFYLGFTLHGALGYVILNDKNNF